MRLGKFSRMLATFDVFVDEAIPVDESDANRILLLETGRSSMSDVLDNL
jgi:hypothetical protein